MTYSLPDNHNHTTCKELQLLRERVNGLELHLDDIRVIQKTEELIDPKLSISEFLSILDEDHIIQLTDYFLDRLEPAAEKVVEGLSLMLKAERRFSAEEHGRVTEHAEKGDRTDGSKLFLSLVMEKGSGAQRVMWEAFVKMRNESPKLDKILNEIQKIGKNVFESMNNGQDIPELPCQLRDVQQKHKEILREENERMKIETIPEAEEDSEYFQLPDQYCELTVVSTDRGWRITEHELWEGHRDNEEWRDKLEKNYIELEKLRTEQLFCSSYSLSRITFGSSVALLGIPGIGKTTLLQKIIYDWATRKIFQQFQFVFSFKFRDLNKIKHKINLTELILNQYQHLGNVLGEVWKNPKALLFIFDGLDEFKHRIDFTNIRSNARTQHTCPDPEWQCDVSDIVSSLIQHKLLPGCSVLVTTRPAALHLLEKADIALWAEILGFSVEEQKEYFGRFFEDQAVATSAFKLQEENKILYSISYNPLYCSAICQSLGDTYVKTDNKRWDLPITITRTFSRHIYNILKHHGRGTEKPDDALMMVGNMAFNGVSEKKTEFTAEDLIKYDLKPSSFLSSFMMELLKRKNSTRSVVYAFTHLIIQQFVAALTQFLRTDPGDILKLLDEVHRAEDGRFEVFLRFVVGLSHSGSDWTLQEFLGPFPDQTAQQVNEWAQKEIVLQIESTETAPNKRQLLNALQYVIESQDRKLAQATMGSAENISFSGSLLTPTDCAILSDAVELSDTIKHLNLESCYIGHEGLERLGPVIQKCQGLGLNCNQLRDSGLKLLSEYLMKPNCQIQILRLAMNGLTDYSADDLVSILHRSCSLQELDLNYNELGDSGVKVLSKALENPECKLIKLRLRANGLTTASAQDLASALGSNRWLTELELGNNDLGDAGVELLAEALINADSKLQTLDLWCNGLRDSSAERLAFTVVRNRSLPELILGENKLGDSAVNLVAAVKTEWECKTKTLCLTKTGLTNSCVEELVSILLEMRTLTHVNLNYNCFTDRSISSFNYLIKNHSGLEYIGLEGNRFTSRGRNQLKTLQTSRQGLTVDL
ncbi:NACHT, LRR and PYD domains-containing protein 3-like [Mobula birostris]|uniref:NACHT, LRR and PYD domains-containing protein 3-like n=1 Tax=Mobula birostris TaxID=1983395 RepID=UPI003B2875E7